jgi:hypothetical protein
MSTWSCPSCSRDVSSYETSCECGFTRAELELPPASETVGSHRVAAPATLFPWLGRALLILRVSAYIGLFYGAVSVLGLFYDAFNVPVSGKGSDASAILVRALLVAVGTLISFAITLGVVDAGTILQAIHRRVGALDERDRAGL